MGPHSRASGTVVGVLALQGAIFEHLEILDGIGVSTRTVRTVAELDEVSGLVIPGGESTAMARLAAGTGLFSAIRRRIDESTLAVLGTCAGLILLSDHVEPAGGPIETIGGLPITAHRNGFGNQLTSFEAELEMEGNPLRAAFIRAPRITQVGVDVHVLARHRGEPVVVEHGNLLAATCHPEITGATALHEKLLELITSRSSHVKRVLAPSGVPVR